MGALCECCFTTGLGGRGEDCLWCPVELKTRRAVEHSSSVPDSSEPLLYAAHPPTLGGDQGKQFNDTRNQAGGGVLGPLKKTQLSSSRHFINMTT